MSVLGFHRGSVVANLDPLARHRLQLMVPAVSGPSIVWAEGCLPVGRKSIPKVGSHVWVTYEAGDPDKPIWVGVRPSGQA